ncbi:MAG: hypothetical protein Q4G22_11915 [Paracoccus sp. (in: a-proteobacteria)]|uniref:hypothetical protein n=1 Tax=Paracoccus sp. TaxID=267 RepID=UPI0026DF38A4|nr:hypothetical protein [Paracoccus sp. (in: a-proteobacteria)]MDO5632528.1 hypothetical protein [Paracoccus sp. (in: a-proteobacteria)]
MHNFTNAPVLFRTTQTIPAFMEWLCSSSDDLIDTADLLGGPKWVILAQGTVSAARDVQRLHASLPHLRKLHRLLTLQYVDDIDSDEARRFMMLHPDDPRADNARRCAEALERGIAALERVSAVALREVA